MSNLIDAFITGDVGRDTDCLKSNTYEKHQFLNVYGYKFGDELLENIGELLSVGYQRYGILAHYEKDCFALFISSIKDAENAVEIAQKIINMFHMPWVLGKHECYSTVSIGISIYPSDGKKAETLIKNAESALAFVKKQGRDRYQLYSKTIDKQVTKRLSIEYSLRKAIEKNEFVVGNVIVAEGVEEESQYQTLKKKNCDIVHGYYFSKPLSFDDLIKYFKRMELH